VADEKRAARRAFWERHVEAHRRSGLSQAVYCARQGLRKGTLSFWRWNSRGRPARRRAAARRRGWHRRRSFRSGSPRGRRRRGWSSSSWSAPTVASGCAARWTRPGSCTSSAAWRARDAEPARGGADLRGHRPDEHAPVLRPPRQPFRKLRADRARCIASVIFARRSWAGPRAEGGAGDTTAYGRPALKEKGHEGGGGRVGVSCCRADAGDRG
jgi:hypothetical protein